MKNQLRIGLAAKAERRPGLDADPAFPISDGRAPVADHSAAAALFVI
ncbi:MAG: hypothetical protein ACU0BZ_00600 [Paracoccus sp. (in: a-proteobacteria)]|tara:strand:+ start:383 stop:523 length:141 start_codon:yes stop_codon:yes gene_type:complete